MPVVEKPNEILLTAKQVSMLWEACRKIRKYPDEEVAIRCVSESEITELNLRYRDKNSATNILTFSYPPNPVFNEYTQTTHDVALCLSVAEKESAERNSELTDYIALLLTHAFLHITGLDHEESSEASATTHELEKTILQQCGFTPTSL